jgi:hypothetical protein
MFNQGKIKPASSLWTRAFKWDFLEILDRVDEASANRRREIEARSNGAEVPEEANAEAPL